ncbi:hypothetical protein Clocel_3094 [Clostridium cellulovorans 743B]|uniref:Uncharacterized protein n=1 Tax=Clostridium cellulovorans (strain ATCC 35296 / DSM 3052 / OCM 3 / 743B) TaxID=573061 RepID=D9STQ0_CLOC7|nr:hypothetical protein Clocel_3094 [Clostridium cellulovorans 743B]
MDKFLYSLDRNTIRAGLLSISLINLGSFYEAFMERDIKLVLLGIALSFCMTVIFSMGYLYDLYICILSEYIYIHLGEDCTLDYLVDIYYPMCNPNIIKDYIIIRNSLDSFYLKKGSKLLIPFIK